MKVTFSGDIATMEFPGVTFGQIASAWVFVDELIVAGDRAKNHKEAERIKREEYTWDRLICQPGGIDA